MIANIVDHRRHRHKWKRVRAIVEAAWHDNSVAGADQAPRDDTSPDYDELDDVTLNAALAWGEAMPGLVTLYIYDAPDVEVAIRDSAT